jgi:hypothetical protein
MPASELKAALTEIASHVEHASRAPLNAHQSAELRKSIAVITASWPSGDAALGRASWLITSLTLSGILSAPSRQPTMPDQLLRDCWFLITHLETRG